MSEISFDNELKQAIKNSVGKLSKAVKSTLGPAGTNVMVLSEISLPVIVNDGVTVAKKIKFKDPLENHIASILKSVSKNTDSVAGDGTTTATTLAEAIILGGIKNIEAGFSPINISKGIHAATKEILKQLEDKSVSVLDNKELLLQVASISANNDKELGKLISDAFTQVGVDGQIEVEDSNTEQTYIEVLNGMKYSSGFESNMFVNTTESTVVLKDCHILIHEGKFRSYTPITSLLQDIRNNNDSILIIADDFDSQALKDLEGLKVQNGIKICAVKSPNFGVAKEKSLEDIAFITNAEIISSRFGRSLDNWDNNISKKLLGKAESITVDSTSFTIIENSVSKEDIQKRVDELKEKVKGATKTEKSELLDRISKLVNGVAVLYVAGNSAIEIAEKKYRIEDAIHATRASLEEGVIPGGGITLLKLANKLKTPKLENRDQELGFEILKKALESPIRTICENADESGDVIIEKVLKNRSFNYGYDARNKKYADLIKIGVIDPKKVTRTALQNASSVSQMILTLNAAIY